MCACRLLHATMYIPCLNLRVYNNLIHCLRNQAKSYICTVMQWIIQGRNRAYSHPVELTRNFAMNHVSEGELGQVLCPKWQSRTDSPLLNQFFQSRAGAKLRKMSHQHLSNHTAEVLLRHIAAEEAREEFAAYKLYSETPIIFLTLGTAHNKLWFFLTSFSFEIICWIILEKIISRYSACSLHTFEAPPVLHFFNFMCGAQGLSAPMLSVQRLQMRQQCKACVSIQKLLTVNILN